MRSPRSIIEARGRVEWWSYTVSHGQLLLRRPKAPSHPRRLDILFKDVVEAHMASFFDNLRVVEAGPEATVVTIVPVGGHRLYRLIGDNATGHVVAGAVAFAEDDKEYDEPSGLIL